MATTTSFKQACPSCDAQVPIKDPSLVGRKIDCPKCKFRFTVEKPPAAAEETTDLKPAQTTKTTDTKAATTKVANGKPNNGKPTAGKTPNGKPVAGKTTSDKVADKTAPAAKNGKPGAKKTKTAEDDTPKKKKKKSGGVSRTLILGGILGVLAIIALVVAGIAFWPSKAKKPTQPGGVTQNPINNNNNTPPKPGDGVDNSPPKDKDPQAPSSIPDISNLLPNNTEVVVAINAPLSSSFKSAAFLTPGAYQDNGLKTALGLSSLEELQRVILAYVPLQNGVFSVMRTTKPIDRSKLKAGLKLEDQPDVKGLNKHLVKAHLDSLSNLLIKGNQPQDACYLHIADDYTLVFANQAVMDQFLGENARPKFLTQPPPETAPKPPDMGGMGQPKPPVQNPPMQGGTKPAASLNPPNDRVAKDGAAETFAREQGTQFVAYQPGRERPAPGTGGRGERPGNGTPAPNPGDPKPPPPNPNPNQPQPPMSNQPPPQPPMPNQSPPSNPNQPPMDTPPASGSFMTVPPELKGILDKVHNTKEQPFLVVAAYGRTKFAAEIGQRLLGAIPRAGSKDNKYGGFGPDSEHVLKSKADPFRDVHLLAICVSKMEQTKLQATVALQAGDEQHQVELEKTVHYFGSIMPYFFRGALDNLDIKGLPADPNAPSTTPRPGHGKPPFPMPGFPPPMPGTPDMEVEIGKGRDGALTMTRAGGTLLLGLEMTPTASAYSILMAKLDELCVQLKSQGELVDARSHVHELAAALQAYVKANNDSFPRGTLDRKLPHERKVSYPPHERVSWMAALLPYLPGGSYRNVRPNPDASWSEGDNLRIAQMIVPEFLARVRADQPATVHYLNLTTPLAATHFVGMAGVGFGAADDRADDPAVANKIGVFGYERVTKLADIKGGLDKTIVLIQVKPEDATPWIVGGGSTVRGVSDSDDPADPLAVKPFVCMQYDGRDGTVAIMGDGKVRFIPATISNKDFRGLCAINGEKPANLDMVAPEIPADDATLKVKPVDPKPAENPMPVSPDPKPDPKPAAVQLPQGWQEYVSKTGNYTVGLPPGTPTEVAGKQTTAVGDINLVTVTLHTPQGGVNCVVIHMDLPPQIVALGDVFLDETMKNGTAKLKDVKNSKITLAGGFSGVEYQGVAETKVPVIQRAYLVNDRMYLLTAGGEPGPLTTAFFDSFRLTKPVVKSPIGKEWKEVISKEGRFAVLMPVAVTPAETKEEKEPFGPVKVTTQIAAVPEAKQIYMTMFADLPDAEVAKGYEAVCKKLLTEMNKTDKTTKVVGEKKITLGAVPGMEYRQEAEAEKAPPGSSRGLIRMYLDKKRLYVLAAGALEGTMAEADALKFLNSFKLVSADGDGGKVTGATEPPPGWKAYTPMGAKFAVYFPTAYEVKTFPNATGTINFAGIQRTTADGLSCICQWLVKRETLQSPEAVAAYLKGAQEGEVKTSKGKLLEEKEITQDGFPGREFLIEVGHDNVVRTRCVVVETQVINLSVWGKDKEAVHSKNAELFFGSLKIAGAKPK